MPYFYGELEVDSTSDSGYSWPGRYAELNMSVCLMFFLWQTTDLRRSRRFMGSWHSSNQHPLPEGPAHTGL